jgi:hypothetical protein
MRGSILDYCLMPRRVLSRFGKRKADGDPLGWLKKIKCMGLLKITELRAKIDLGKPAKKRHLMRQGGGALPARAGGDGAEPARRRRPAPESPSKKMDTLTPKPVVIEVCKLNHQPCQRVRGTTTK